ncbi:MAG: tetratricopeptide repeat protein [Nitrospiraceae bacterium]|nr:tetratricopeptide repeat protein [Nitrospiraceae bacterium]
MKKYLYLYASVLLLALCNPVISFSKDVYETRLNEGLKNTEPYSYILIKNAEDNPAKAELLLKEAIQYSPNLPISYFNMAWHKLTEDKAVFESLDYALRGFEEYSNNFWWLRSLTGLIIASVVLSFALMLLGLVFLKSFKDIRLLSHDIKEDKKKILMVLSLIIFSIFGPLFFITALLAFFGIYFEKKDKIIVYAALLFLLASPFFLKITNSFISANSPDLRAVVSINESRESKYALLLLKDKNAYVPQFLYGLALKKEGRYEEAIAVYKNLLSTNSEPKAYVNLGNIYFSMNDINNASEAYKKAIEIKPLASAYYNLSLVSREKLDFQKGGEYFLEATKLDSRKITQFSETAEKTGKNPNRVLIDETLSMSEIWNYANTGANNTMNINISTIGSGLTFIIALILIVLFYYLNSSKNKSYICSRCGTVICGKCTRGKHWGQMCSVCYSSVVKPEGLDARERIAKLLDIQSIQARKYSIVRLISYAPPGFAHIFAGRILEGCIYLWIFFFFLAMLILNPFISIGLSTFTHTWINIPSLTIMAIIYMATFIGIRRRLNRGWL